MGDAAPKFIPTLVTFKIHSFYYEPTKELDRTSQRYGAALATNASDECVDELKDEVMDVYQTLCYYGPDESNKICPSILAFIVSNGGEVHEKLFEVNKCTWVCDTMIQNPKDPNAHPYVVEPAVHYSVRGRVHVELGRPSSIDAVTFRKEFTAMMCEWSTHVVPKTWMACGYTLSVSPDEGINKLT